MPTEYSSGASGLHGSIIKVANAHLRRLVIETAWQPRPRKPPPLTPRSHNAPHSAVITTYPTATISAVRATRWPTAATGRQRTPPPAPTQGRISPINSRCGAMVAAGPPRRATGAPPRRHQRFLVPFSTAKTTDGAALGSQPLVCRFLRSPVPRVRPLAVAFRRSSRHCCGHWWNMIPCRFHCCVGSVEEPGRRMPCSPL